MLHPSRLFAVRDLSSSEELARALAQPAESPELGYRIGQYLFLNDSTNDELFDYYAVLRRLEGGGYVQIATHRSGMNGPSEALTFVDSVLRGMYDNRRLQTTVLNPLIKCQPTHDASLGPELHRVDRLG